jgi:pyocin large subunit-like protein
MFRWFVALAFALLSFATACSRGDAGVARQQTSAAVAAAPPTQAPQGAASQASRSADEVKRPDVGFRSRAQFNEHFQKHGAEFGHITQAEYLRQAQMLRDAPVGGSIEEIRRDDGTVSRFDRSTGAFLAFNRDGTIRTFFKPNDGEAYFRRQASRVH